MGATKKVLISITVLILVAFSAYAADKHPEKMGSKDCLECHMDVTPEIYKQWEQSAHGFTGVKCGVCHGDESNFVKSPLNATCEGCHSKQVEFSQAPQARCSSCHIAHNFTVHKVHDYK
jgi:hypothetical protein